MRSDDPDFQDLTARARIRNVALAHFAERGDKATTIRGVAQDAGVSPSLVQHHFGTKVGLRQACDAYVSDQLQRGVDQGITEQGIGDPDFLSAAYQTAPLIMRYLARALTDGSPTGAALFDEIVAVTEEYLAGNSESEPPPEATGTRAQAAVFTAMKLGVVVLHQHLSRALGIDALGPAGLTQVRTAMLDIVAPSFSGEELTKLARSGLDQHLQRHRDEGGHH
jgi:AcrR family transcriptional regulator